MSTTSREIGAEIRAPHGLMTPHEAARWLALSPRTLWSLTASGELPAVRIRRSVRYRPADLEAFAERCYVQGWQ